MSENPTPETLTVAQVAEYLHLHALTVRRLLKEGTIPARKVGREWQIPAYAGTAPNWSAGSPSGRMRIPRRRRARDEWAAAYGSNLNE